MIVRMKPNEMMPAKVLLQHRCFGAESIAVLHWREAGVGFEIAAKQGSRAESTGGGDLGDVLGGIE